MKPLKTAFIMLAGVADTFGQELDLQREYAPDAGVHRPLQHDDHRAVQDPKRIADPRRPAQNRGRH
jgi:hypothetical protein